MYEYNELYIFFCRIYVLWLEYFIFSGHHEKLTPFKLDSSEVLEHEIISLLINDTEVELNVWDNNGPVKFDLNTNIIARYTDYR